MAKDWTNNSKNYLSERKRKKKKYIRSQIVPRYIRKMTSFKGHSHERFHSEFLAFERTLENEEIS